MGDAGIVAAIWLAGWAIFARPDWLFASPPAGLFFVAATGAALSVAIELHALRTGRWAYSDAMPVVPLLGVGVAPVAQMIVLPLSVLFLTQGGWRRI